MLRSTIAEHLTNDPGSQVAYHNWSMRTEGHEFVGFAFLLHLMVLRIVGGAVVSVGIEFGLHYNDPWTAERLNRLLLAGPLGVLGGAMPSLAGDVAIGTAGGISEWLLFDESPTDISLGAAFGAVAYARGCPGNSRNEVGSCDLHV